MDHPARDDYWRHGSVCEDYAAIDARDLYGRRLGRRLYQCVLAAARQIRGAGEGADRPLGPWLSPYARPGPQIGFLQESLRWWDRWLKGIDNGVTEEPALHAWIQESAPPASDYDQRDGRWVAAASWPPPVPPHVMHFADGRLSDAPQPMAPILTHRSPQLTGTTRPATASAW